MELDIVLKYVVAVISVVLIVLVLLQTRSGGLGTVFGGSSGGDLYKSRRGFEGFLYNATIFLGIVFALVSVAIAIVS